MALTITSAGVEFRKLLSRRKYIVLTIVQLAICFFVMLGVGMAYSGLSQMNMYDEAPTTSVLGSLSTMGASSGVLPLSALSVIMSVVLPLFVFMMASDTFAHELEDGTIRCSLLRPISRAKIFISKLLAIWLFAICNLLITCVLLSLMRFIMFGGTGGYLSTVLAYVISAVPVLPFIAMAALIAIAARNSTLSMFLSLIAYIAMFAVTLFSPTFGAAFFINHLGFYKYFLGISVNVGSAGNTLLLLLSTTAILSLGAYALFDRRQV